MTLAVVLCGLILGSHPRLTGDGYEYLTLSQRFVHFQGPSLSSEDARVGAFSARPLANRQGRFELWHFWLFPLLAAPFVALASTLDLPPLAGFAIFNSLLLLYACWSVARRSGPWAAVFLFFSPIVWWSDKAQVEVFTVALLAIAATTLDRLSIAALCCALASTQNPPIAILAIAAAAAACLHRYLAIRGPVWAWLAASVLILLHPAYYLVRLGRLTPLTSANEILIPSVRFLLTPLLDLNVGVLWRAPLFALAGAAAWLFAVRRARAGSVLVALGALVLLLSFAQALNVNSGGTPGMDRYPLWLFPLALPLVGVSARSRIVRVLIAVSAVYSPVAFRPSRQESFLQPTALALHVWTLHPAWDNPSAEIFAERLRHQDGVNTLAATATCEKVLVNSGAWPTGCTPVPLPGMCRAALCYANLRPDGTYGFVITARRPGRYIRIQ